MQFQADANEVIEEMGTTISNYVKQVAVLQSQLKAADRQVHSLQDQIDQMRGDDKAKEPGGKNRSVKVVEGEVQSA